MMQRLRVPLLLVLAAGLAVVGWLLMSTNFMIHDDEGYVLLGLRDFSEGRRLYNEIFTQYGPVPFLYYDTLHRLLDWPVTNLFGRALTLLHWVTTAAAAGLIAWRLTQRYWAAVFTLVAVFSHLWQMTWEPPHPGGLIAVIVAVGLAAAIELLSRQRPAAATAVLGVAGAALLLTKVNVGVFWTCWTGAFLLLHTGGARPRAVGAWLAAAGLAMLPFALTQALLHDPRVLGLAVMFAVAGVTLCAQAPAENAPGLSARAWFAGIAGCAGLGTAVLAVIMLKGTTAPGLLNGVLLDPLRHPANFHFSFPWPVLAWVLLVAAVTVTILHRARPALRPRLADAVAGLRLVALLYFAWHVRTWLTVEGPPLLISLTLPLTPLFLLPLGEPAAGDWRRPALALLALVGFGQVLHSYPVAGTQMAWGSFLVLPLFASGLAEATAHFASRLRRPWLEPAVAAIALLAAAGQATYLSHQAWNRWSTSTPLGLPGAETLRPPENIRYALRILTANAALHGDMLYSRPGMFSFNLWTGLPTPTSRNSTHWFWQLQPAEQEAVIARLSSGPRPVIISSRPLSEFLDRELHMPITGPLNDYINRNYRSLFTVTGYDFLVPRTSTAAPFYVARNFQRAPGSPDPESSLITVNVALSATVTRIVLRDLAAGRTLGQWDAGNSRATLDRINTAGQPANTPQPCPWPLRIEGLRQLRLYHNTVLPTDHPDLQLQFLDAAGESVFEACYDDPANASARPAGG